MTEIKKGDEFVRKYKLTAEKKSTGEKSLEWMAEIKGKGDPVSRRYTFQRSTAPAVEKAKGTEKSNTTARVVEIDEAENGGTRKVFFKAAAFCNKSNRKELSLQAAALIIQMSYRAHLVHRSQVLCSLRGLAVAKGKLKEIRALFSNFSYCCHLAHNAEDQQRFSQKIISVLLTVDAIEELDCMVRAAKKSIAEELVAMLAVVNLQQFGKLGLLKRRKFDPAGMWILLGGDAIWSCRCCAYA